MPFQALSFTMKVSRSENFPNLIQNLPIVAFVVGTVIAEVIAIVAAEFLDLVAVEFVAVIDASQIETSSRLAGKFEPPPLD